MQKKALVTGAGGFIGSHLTEYLVSRGDRVRVLLAPNESTAFLHSLDVEHCHGDLRDPQSLRPVVDGIDIVYHLAAISLHDAKIADGEYVAVNVEGTKSLLDASVAAGIKRFLYTATIEAVGMSRDGKPLTEDSEQHPRNIYGCTKLAAEKQVLAHARAGKIDGVVVRPPMIYGPRELILLRRLFRIIALGFYPLIGSGQALTEFCYVKNLVKGIVLAAELGRAGEVYFISDEMPYSIEDIVTTIAQEMDVRVWTPHIPVPIAMAIGATFEVLSQVLPFYPFRIPQTGRPPFSRKTVEWTANSRLYVDISKARRELGYVPEYSLAQGVRETLDWYSENKFLS